MSGVFKAYDIRGIYHDGVDEELAYKVGFFLPRLLDTNKVMVGRDIRLSSPSLFENMRAGIVDSGADCLDLGLATTPYVYFSTIFSGMCASVQITASHNSKNYNGFKISGSRAFPIGSETGLAELEDMVRNKPVVPAKNAGKTVTVDNRSAYLNYQRQFLTDLSDLDITFDLSNGMSSLFAREIFGEEGARRHYINSVLDGSFPAHEPNPLDEKNCIMLEKEVLVNGSDVGVIFDGDADRVVFVDEKGRFIQPDYVTAVIGEYYKEIAHKENGCVVCDIRTSKSSTEYLSMLGYDTRLWKVGHAFAKRKMRELHGLFGGELAGHYYYRDFFYCDSGIHSAVLVLNVVAKLKREGKTLSGLIDSIVNYSNSGEMNYEIEDKDSVIEEMKSVYGSKALSKLDFDGIRYDFGSWWFSMRKSNTEPLLRLIIEAENRELLGQKKAEIEKIIERWKVRK